MPKISSGTFSLVPGFDKQKKELLRLLNRAAVLSETLRLEIDRMALAPQLTHISEQLDEMIAHQRER